MPTVKPRVQVVLEPETHRTLARVARYLNTSMSGLIGQLVEEAAPTLQHLADTLEQAQGLGLKLPGAVQVKMADLDRQAHALEHGVQEVLDQVQDQAAERREEQDAKLPPRPASQGKTL